MSLGYAHLQLRSFYLRSTFCGAHVRKNTRLSPQEQVQFLVPERRNLGTRLFETRLRTRMVHPIPWNVYAQHTQWLLCLMYIKTWAKYCMLQHPNSQVSYLDTCNQIPVCAFVLWYDQFQNKLLPENPTVSSLTPTCPGKCFVLQVSNKIP